MAMGFGAGWLPYTEHYTEPYIKLYTK
ncbi:hypothetical protein PSAC2689_40019 [Paraburkholderia sacchari]